VETCGEVWRRVETCGDVWRRVETCGDVWRRVETCGDVWRRVETCGDMEAYGAVECGVEVHGTWCAARVRKEYGCMNSVIATSLSTSWTYNHNTYCTWFF
jgi:hypothetical protein